MISNDGFKPNAIHRSTSSNQKESNIQFHEAYYNQSACYLLISFHISFRSHYNHNRNSFIRQEKKREYVIRRCIAPYIKWRCPFLFVNLLILFAAHTIIYQMSATPFNTQIHRHIQNTHTHSNAFKLVIIIHQFKTKDFVFR